MKISIPSNIRLIYDVSSLRSLTISTCDPMRFCRILNDAFHLNYFKRFFNKDQPSN